MKPSDTITLNAPSAFPLRILHEVAIMTILITRGESLRARPLPPARCARCLPPQPLLFSLSDKTKTKTKAAVFQFQKTNAFLFSRALPATRGVYTASGFCPLPRCLPCTRAGSAHGLGGSGVCQGGGAAKLLLSRLSYRLRRQSAKKRCRHGASGQPQGAQGERFADSSARHLRLLRRRPDGEYVVPRAS